jgi:AcrR family transcriptional regulator
VPIAANAHADQPGPRERQRVATREAVLAAALALFSRRGFDGTALPAVAAASSVPVPLIVYHFRSKDGLWRACVDAVYARVEAHVAGYADRTAAALGVERYRIQIRAYVTALAAYPEYMRIVILEGMEPSERLTWLIANHQGRVTGQLVALIEAAQGDGLLPRMDATYAKFLLSGAMSLPIVLAAEYRLIDGTDSLSNEFIEAHIERAISLIMPGLAGIEGEPEPRSSGSAGLL